MILNVLHIVYVYQMIFERNVVSVVSQSDPIYGFKCIFRVLDIQLSESISFSEILLFTAYMISDTKYCMVHSFVLQIRSFPCQILAFTGIQHKKVCTRPLDQNQFRLAVDWDMIPLWNLDSVHLRWCLYPADRMVSRFISIQRLYVTASGQCNWVVKSQTPKLRFCMPINYKLFCPFHFFNINYLTKRCSCKITKLDCLTRLL